MSGTRFLFFRRQSDTATRNPRSHGPVRTFESMFPLLDHISSLETALKVVHQFEDLAYRLKYTVLTNTFSYSVFKDIVSEQEEARRMAIESEIIGSADSMVRQEGEVS